MVLGTYFSFSVSLVGSSRVLFAWYSGPLLAGAQGRDYKNVHSDVKKLERIGLIGRTQDDKVEVPWDIVEARLRLAA